MQAQEKGQGEETLLLSPPPQHGRGVRGLCPPKRHHETRQLQEQRTHTFPRAAPGSLTTTQNQRLLGESKCRFLLWAPGKRLSCPPQRESQSLVPHKPLCTCLHRTHEPGTRWSRFAVRGHGAGELQLHKPRTGKQEQGRGSSFTSRSRFPVRASGLARAAGNAVSQHPGSEVGSCISAPPGNSQQAEGRALPAPVCSGELLPAVLEQPQRLRVQPGPRRSPAAGRCCPGRGTQSPRGLQTEPCPSAEPTHLLSLLLPPHRPPHLGLHPRPLTHHDQGPSPVLLLGAKPSSRP